MRKKKVEKDLITQYAEANYLLVKLENVVIQPEYVAVWTTRTYDIEYEPMFKVVAILQSELIPDNLTTTGCYSVIKIVRRLQVTSVQPNTIYTTKEVEKC